jgi:hypothetical protein
MLPMIAMPLIPRQDEEALPGPGFVCHQITSFVVIKSPHLLSSSVCRGISFENRMLNEIKAATVCFDISGFCLWLLNDNRLTSLNFTDTNLKLAF